MLVIHPDECIDCGVCEPECPADAIRPDTEPDMEQVGRVQPQVFRELAGDRHQEGPAAGRRGPRRRSRQDGEVLLRGPRRGRLSRRRYACRKLDSFSSMRLKSALKRFNRVRGCNLRRFAFRSSGFCAMQYLQQMDRDTRPDRNWPDTVRHHELCLGVAQATRLRHFVYAGDSNTRPRSEGIDAQDEQDQEGRSSVPTISSSIRRMASGGSSRSKSRRSRASAGAVRDLVREGQDDAARADRTRRPRSACAPLVLARHRRQGAATRSRARPASRRAMWSRRAQEYEQKINSGDLIVDRRGGPRPAPHRRPARAVLFRASALRSRARAADPRSRGGRRHRRRPAQQRVDEVLVGRVAA